VSALSLAAPSRRPRSDAGGQRWGRILAPPSLQYLGYQLSGIASTQLARMHISFLQRQMSPPRVACQDPLAQLLVG